LLNKFFIFFFISISISLNLKADEKELIISRLIDINNITFDFEQITNDKKEVGSCILAFDDRLSCDYKDSMQKNILINGKNLVIQHKRYNKIYFYSVSNSPFIKIFNKDNLINLIRDSEYQLDNNIVLTYLDSNKEKIIIFFRKDNYDILGWRVIDKLQNVINFSIKINHVNSEINSKIFKIPPMN